MRQAVREARRNVRHAAQQAGRGLWQAAGFVFSGVFQLARSFFRNIVAPIAVTGFNLLGYLLDKILFGSPVLRAYTAGPLPHQTPIPVTRVAAEGWGWNPYNRLGGVADNLIGILGLGFGVLGYFNLAWTSAVRALKASYNLLGYKALGQSGTLWPKPVETEKDPCPLALRILFALITLPLWAPIALVTNSLDFLVTFFKHTFISLGTHSAKYWNLLGDNGVFPTQKPVDPSHSDSLPLYFYGTLSLIPVFLVCAITNSLNVLLTGISYFIQAAALNFLVYANLLGDNGSFSKRQSRADLFKGKTNPRVWTLFAVLSSPLWLSLALVSNTVDGLITFVANSFKSLGCNIANYWNLLGKHGVFINTERETDNRADWVKYFYGAVSFIPVALICGVTNFFNLLLTSVWTVLESARLNFLYYANRFLPSLGVNSVFGKPYSVDDLGEDRRHPWFKAIATVVSALIWIVPVILTNLIDALLTGAVHFALNFIPAVRDNFHYFKSVLAFSDYSISFTNPQPQEVLTDGSSVAKPLLSAPLADDLNPTQDSVAKKVESEKSPYSRTFFSVISSPLWLPAVVLTNFFDLVVNSMYHFAYSVRSMVLVGHNAVLNEWSILNPVRFEYDDITRYLGTRLVFGFLSIWVWLPIIILTNSIDLIATAISGVSINLAASFYYSFRANYHWLGSYGIMGERVSDQANVDFRHPVVQKIFLTLNFILLVLPLSIVLSNLVDALASVVRNTYKAMVNNIWNLSRWPVDRESVFWSSDETQKTPPMILVPQEGLAVGESLLASKGLDENPAAPPARTWSQFSGVVIFSALSFPLWFPVVFVSNFFDMSLVFIKNFFQNVGHSLYHNIRPLLNLLGSYSVLFSKRVPYSDHRHWAIRLFFGLLTCPVVIPVLLVANVADLFLSSIKYSAISIGQSCSYYWEHYSNILGNYGYSSLWNRVVVAAPAALPIASAPPASPLAAKSWDEEEPKALDSVINPPVVEPLHPGLRGADYLARNSIGLVGFFIMLPVLLLSNLMHLVLTFAWHLGKSAVENYLSVSNLLGLRGVFGERHKYNDSRHWGVRVVFGFLSAVPVFVLALISNSLDFLFTSIKKVAQTLLSKSFWVDYVLTAVLVLSSPVWWTAAFYLRKLTRSLYNAFIRPFIDPDYNFSRWLGSLMVLLTAGIFSVAKLVFKLATGYSSHFGFEKGILEFEPSEEALSINYQIGRTIFRLAIAKAKAGKEN